MKNRISLGASERTILNGNNTLSPLRKIYTNAFNVKHYSLHYHFVFQSFTKDYSGYCYFIKEYSS